MAANTLENRQRLSKEHVGGMSFDDITDLAEWALEHEYERNDEYFQEQWSDRIEDVEEEVKSP